MQPDAQLSLAQRFRIAKARSRRLLAKGGGASAHTEWMNECVPDLMDSGKDQDVAVAACLNMWRDAWEESHPDGAVDPGPSRKPASEDSPLADKQWQIARARELLKAWDESKHPRVPAGGPDGGQFGEGGGGTEGGAKPSGGKGKKKIKYEDFAKAKIKITGDPARQDAVIEKWNEKIGEDPADFKQKFMGGLDGDMTIQAYGITGKFSLNGEIKDEDQVIGTFTRDFDVDNKSAYSAYFKLNKNATKHDTGKKMLAGNVAMYQQLGIEKVSVTANIDVGGYAWAKYGYVPTQEAWNSLRGSLERKLTGGGAVSSGRISSGNEADSWDQLSSDVQDDVRDRWMRDNRSEFIDNEVQNWRDSGQAKDDAKVNLAHDFGQYSDIPEWVSEALDATRKRREDKDEPPIPYTNKQLYDAISLDYESDGEGRADPSIDFIDDALTHPAGYEPTQGTLPGIEPLKPASFLTKEMREQISGDITDGFNEKAESDADDAEPPSYLAENVSEFQEEYWDSMDDTQRLYVAERFDMHFIPKEPSEEEPPQQEMELPPKPAEDPVLAAVRSSDPKSIWKVADSARGKELLLGTGWSGVLNLKDKDSMARFNKYVGRAAA